MIQKEKIRDMGYFLAALATGLLPFAAPERCAQALREGLAYWACRFILWNGLSGCVLRQQGGCSSLDFWEALPRRPAQRLRPSIPGSSQPKRQTPSSRPVSVPALPL